MSIAAPPAPNQLPVGGVVAAGSATINTAGSTININQTSNRVAINWNSFDVGSNATVNFVQPSASAVALNRVNSANPSQIYGNLNANGQVFLMNSAGVYFAPGANVNVGGIVATTHQMGDADFMNGSNTFSRNGSSGSVANDGTIKSGIGGYIALLAPEVQNNGILVAHQGTVVLAGGEAITLNFGDLAKLSSLTIAPSLIKTLVENKLAIQVPDGLIILSSRAVNQLAGSVINSGNIQADGITQSGGRIILEASSSINHSGNMSANAAPTSKGNGGTIAIIADLSNLSSTTNINGRISAKAGSLGGDGGNVETSASKVSIGDLTTINTSAPQGKSGTWTIDPTDFTVAASGGDITGTLLSSNLSTTNVDIFSTSGSSGTAGNINIIDVITWSSNFALTLNAQNNININSAITANGASAKLALQYGQGAVSTGNLSNYFVNAPINVQSGNNFSTKLGSDGSTLSYTVINSLGAAGSMSRSDLQGMNGTLDGNFALGSNLNAIATSSWNSGAGFTPIGSTANSFTGRFDGLGHTITGLTINQPTIPNIGLFGATSGPTTIQNIGLVGGTTTGAAGTGGLIGHSDAGLVNNSYNTGNVTGAAGTGGLVGSNTTGSITNSHASGVIIGAAGSGGLEGSVTSGSISNSYATGNVTGAAGTGGLVGSSTSGNVIGAYATGNVSGNAGSGGLVGSITSGNVTASFATGNVTGAAGTGGLIGSSTEGNVTSTYATGNVSGAAGSGGLVGSITSGAISNSYAAGSVAGGAGMGGIVGATSGAITASYWNKSTGPATSVGGGTGLTTSQMQQQANFAGWDFANTWLIYSAQSNPLLQTFLSPLTITANSPSMTYSGNTFSGVIGITYSSTPNSNLLGPLSYSGPWSGAIDVGSYGISASGLYSNQLGYKITYADGSLVITKAHLTVTGNDATKTYGDANPVLSSTVSGFVNSQNLASSGVTGTGAATTTATALTDVGTAVIAADAGTLAASNYDFTNTVNGNLAITKAHLTVTSNNATKTYGDANPPLSSTVSGFVNSQTLVTSGVSGEGTATTTATTTSNIGTAVITTGVGTLAATNYDFTNLVNGNLAIGQAPLIVAGATTATTYNGAPQMNTGASYSGQKGSDAFTIGGYASGTNYSVTPYADHLAVTGSALANYRVSYTNGSLAIGQATLTIYINDATKVINTPNPIFTSTVSGFQGSDNLINSTNNIINYSTAATTSSGVGNYLITASGLIAKVNNYKINDIDGTLKITTSTGINSLYSQPPSINSQCTESLLAISLHLGQLARCAIYANTFTSE